MIVVKIQGGLGNQLFQYSAGRALALNSNTELVLDLSFYNNSKYSKLYRLDKFNLPYRVGKDSDFLHLKNKNTIPKIFKAFQKLGMRFYPFYIRKYIFEYDLLKIYENKNRYSKDYYLEGWFASENYFKEYKDIITNDLIGPPLLGNENILMLKQISNSNSISIHVRRGDYLNNPYFRNLPLEYYHKSIDLIVGKINNPVFYFFSDDITWTKKEFLTVPNAIFVEKNSIPETASNTSGDIDDLILMRSCKHHIIANSTFSWWGAWLNKNPAKIVLAPSKWYNNLKAQKEYQKGNLIPSDWKIIPFK